MPIGIGLGLSPELLSGLVAPVAPTNLVATQDGVDVDLTWTDAASNELGYYIYRSSYGGSYSLIDTIAANSTSYTDTAPGSGIWYYYVSAYNAIGEVASNVASVVVYLLRDLFTTPEGFTADLSDNNDPFDSSNVSVDVGGGVSGDAANFDGTTEYIQIPTGFGSVLDPNEITIMGFLKVSGSGIWTDGISHMYLYIVSNDYANGGYFEKRTINNTVRMIYGGVSQSFYSLTSTDYIHFCITFSLSADEFIGYKNGVAGGVAQTGLSSQTNTYQNRLYIGSTSGPGSFWDGDIDLVRIYNHALTPAEIAEHYNSGAGLAWGSMSAAQKSGCILAYDFDEMATPRTCEPGPGTLGLVDTNLLFSVGSGELQINSNAPAGFGDSKIYGISGYARAAGLALIFKEFSKPSGGLIEGGFAQTTNLVNTCSVYYSSTVIRWDVNGGSYDIGTITYNVDYNIIEILKTSGSLFMIKGGLEYPEWTLLWVDTVRTFDPVYFGFSAVATNVMPQSVSSIELTQLPAPFNTDYGIATDREAGSVAAGTTYTHEADCIIEFTQTTVPSAGQTEVWFRSPTVGTDGWRVTIDSSGNLDLDEVVSGTPTQRGTSAGVIANGDRVVVVADGTTINVYEANTLRITYTSASTNQTETGGELDALGTGGVVSDLIAWPRTLSGSASTTLDAV